ncbi:hypothetical protein ASD24_24730 [Paenibacillus sp. Root52]|uniref:phage tail tip lysozyme n=1 Tax=Paenibacillus sp. Root52 TaxID=1736552 RepID=UPI0006F5D72A|nr:phage tail tip lysozyme [Paenibacillus sp. Root52]KQY91004.1 hypothetical protein ASD24_24730 [Paenibacillus sp. Root52]
MSANGGAGGKRPLSGAVSSSRARSSGQGTQMKQQATVTNSDSARGEVRSDYANTKSKLAGGVRTGSSSGGSKASVASPAINQGDKASQSNPSRAGNVNPALGARHNSSEGNATKQNNDHNKAGSSGVNGAHQGKAGSSGELANQEGLRNKAKGMTSNATGVDYSDKSKKDQLEHQAADAAMDLTPGLAQANSVRKKLKEHNRRKNQAGGKDDSVTDKAEEVADKAVDGGIKATKAIAATAAGGKAAGAALIGMMMMKMMMMLKGVVMAGVSKVVGALATAFNAVSSFVSGILGVGAAIGNAVTAGVVAVTVTTTSVLGYGVVGDLTLKDDSISNCVPNRTIVRQGSQDYLLNGELEVIREANAVKVWSVYERIGGSKEQTAAVLGNLQHESGLDPTGVETIYNEPFQIGPRKQTAMGVGFNVSKINAKYAAKYPAIKYVGIGLAQWTNGRNNLLVKYAQSHSSNWYDFDTQIKFMLEGDDALRQKQLIDFLHTPPSNVQKETERFMNTWIGLSSPNNSLSQRLKNAANFMFVLERSTTDTAYADSILSDVNVGRSEGNRAVAAYYQDDGCGNPIKSHYGNQSIDGTGEVPADLVLVPWSRQTLPASLQVYAKNPEDAGLVWGSSTGWANGIIPDQCAALAHSYFMRLYPDWNQGGRPTDRPYGDGKDVADGWAKHYDQAVSGIPASGAVFSDATTSRYGHTGVVQHVFANGDILVNEQNIRGVSGRNAPGLSYSWSWRVIKKDRYEKDHWKFFKPADAAPQWRELETY